MSETKDPFQISGEIRKTPLSQIDSDNIHYRISSRKSPEALAKAVSLVGLLQPPFLRRLSGETSRFIIVSGFRRIEACRSLGWNEIEARIIDGSVDECALSRIAVCENSFQRPLNHVEKAGCVRLLQPFFPRIEDLGRELALLGLPENRVYLSRLVQLMDLPEELQDAVAADVVPLPMALSIGCLEPGVGLVMTRLFQELTPSLNKQREILTLLKEISLRENRLIPSILGEVLSSNEKDTDRNRKIRLLREALLKRRYPALSAAKERFASNLSALDLPSDIRLIPPDNFEGTTYWLKIPFQTIPQLQEQTALLENLLNDPELEKLVER